MVNVVWDYMVMLVMAHNSSHDTQIVICLNDAQTPPVEVVQALIHFLFRDLQLLLRRFGKFWVKIRVVLVYTQRVDFQEEGPR